MIGGQTTGENAAQRAAEQNAKAAAAQMKALDESDARKRTKQSLDQLAGVTPSTPLTVLIGNNKDKELQTMTALVGVMDALYPQRDRDIGESFEVGRIANYFHSRYGIAPQS